MQWRAETAIPIQPSAAFHSPSSKLSAQQLLLSNIDSNNVFPAPTIHADALTTLSTTLSFADIDRQLNAKFAASNAKWAPSYFGPQHQTMQPSPVIHRAMQTKNLDDLRAQQQQPVRNRYASFLHQQCGMESTVKIESVPQQQQQSTNNSLAVVNASIYTFTANLGISGLQNNQSLQQRQQIGGAFQNIKKRLPPLDRPAEGVLEPSFHRPSVATVGANKPVLLLEQCADLLKFRRTEPIEWSKDDVIAWILDVARRHKIPCEQLIMTKFAMCTGSMLMSMTERRFKEHDPNHGSLLFHEFCKLVTDETFIDDLMRTSTTTRVHSCAQVEREQSQLDQMALHRPKVDAVVAVNLSDACGQQSTGILPTTIMEQKIQLNKNGRQRKRSKHTRGKKLWEFIRDALKNPSICPSVVRWENPAEGVFRIVKSEDLAFLWGQKKKNPEMNYDKMSRSMRYYYDKEILVPASKSGRPSKKLVYKFGPYAHGWQSAALAAVQLKLVVNRAETTKTARC